jgi:hypothetical protein
MFAYLEEIQLTFDFINAGQTYIVLWAFTPADLAITPGVAVCLYEFLNFNSQDPDTI